MRNPLSEMIDLALTQAIEGYMEMEPEAAYDAIIAEWHEQMAILLVEFFFKPHCPTCTSMPDFIQMPREDGDSLYYVPMCSCDLGDRA